MVLTQLMARAGLALRRDVTLGALLERLALVHGRGLLAEAIAVPGDLARRGPFGVVSSPAG